MPSIGLNLIPNATGMYGLIGWTNSTNSSSWAVGKYGRNPIYYFMNTNSETGSDEEWYIESLPIAIDGGLPMFLSGSVTTAKQTAGTSGIEILCFDISHNLVDKARSSIGQGINQWMPLEVKLTPPESVAYVKIRCFIGPESKTTFTGWQMLKLEYGNIKTDFVDSIDPRIYEQFNLMMQHAFTFGNIHRVSHNNLADILGIDLESDDPTRDKHVSNLDIKQLYEKEDYRFYKRTYICNGSNQVNLPESEYFTPDDDSLDVYVNSGLQANGVNYTELPDGSGIIFEDGDIQEDDIIILKWYIKN